MLRRPLNIFFCFLAQKTRLKLTCRRLRITCMAIFVLLSRSGSSKHMRVDAWAGINVFGIRAVKHLYTTVALGWVSSRFALSHQLVGFLVYLSAFCYQPNWCAFAITAQWLTFAPCQIFWGNWLVVDWAPKFIVKVKPCEMRSLSSAFVYSRISTSRTHVSYGITVLSAAPNSSTAIARISYLCLS